MSKLAQMLQLYCRVNNIDVRELAKQLDVSAATVSRLQNGNALSQENMIKVLTWLFADPKTSGYINTNKEDQHV